MYVRVSRPVCDHGRRGLGCACHSVRYDECERTILENCYKLRPEQVLPDPNEQENLCRTLRQRGQGKKAELQNIEQRLNNLIDQIERTKSESMRDRYDTRARQLEGEIVSIKQQIAENVEELQKAESGLQSFTEWRKDLLDLRKRIAGDVELRLRLRTHLRELIERIEVFAVGFQKRYDDDEEMEIVMPLPETERRAAKVAYVDSVDCFAEEVDAILTDCNAELIQRKPYGTFLEYITERRMSREGRFFRVRFKTGAQIDAVPEGSLASGSKLVKVSGRKAGLHFISPSIDRLWREYQAGRNK